MWWIIVIIVIVLLIINWLHSVSVDNREAKKKAIDKILNEYKKPESNEDEN